MIEESIRRYLQNMHQEESSVQWSKILWGFQLKPWLYAVEAGVWFCKGTFLSYYHRGRILDQFIWVSEETCENEMLDVKAGSGSGGNVVVCGGSCQDKNNMWTLVIFADMGK